MFRVVTIAREDTAGAIGRTLICTKMTIQGAGSEIGSRQADMLARIEHQKAHRFRIEEIMFLVITVGPWIVLVWLLWPHR